MTQQLPKKIILITEDEPSMLHVLLEALTQNGFDTLQANNGGDGLKLALQKHPDLILLDILMPKTDGLTMMTNLRKDNWGKTVPVIILTNVNPDTNAILQSIVENQPAYYIIKSNTKLEHIVEKIQELLKIPNESSS